MYFNPGMGQIAWGYPATGPLQTWPAVSGPYGGPKGSDPEVSPHLPLILQRFKA